MRLVALFLSEIDKRRWWLVAYLLLQGAGTAAVIAVVGDIYHRPEFILDLQLLGYFVVGAAAVIYANYMFRRMTIAGTENVMQTIRDRYAAMLSRSDLQNLEQSGTAQTYDLVGRSTTTISEAAIRIVDGTQATATIAAMSLFILYLSPFAFAVLAVIVGAIALHNRSVRAIRNALFRTASSADSKFFDLLGHAIWGFKEVKMNSKRADVLGNEFIMPASTDARDSKTLARFAVLKETTIASALFYLLWAAVVFVIPQYLDDQHKVFSLVLGVTYMMFAFYSMMNAIPALSQVDAAFDQLDELERQLCTDDDDQEAAASQTMPAFQSLETSALVFAHTMDDGQVVFTLGPCDVAIHPGEVIIFCGGNGSGKSTLLKTLAFLYVPRSGTILWDGVPVDRTTAANYRNLFATVFWDFHLFDRLYGLPERTEAEVNELLEELGLGHLTRFENGIFSRTDLSTGQQKRLAFAVAILERRPILILDEVAAEQDAEFRERFYREIVPRLKAQGHTVLIASHDERYFDAADRIIRLRDGRIVEEAPP